MTFFPQIGEPFILTQSPYASQQSYQNLQTPVDTGMVWSFPLVAGGLTGYPTSPLSKFQIAFSSITDAEVNALYAFFTSMGGRLQAFSLLDPGGNLLQFSEAFNNAYWSKTSSVTTGQGDPYGHPRACSLTAGYIQAVVGPSAGGMSGFVMCASIYLNAQGAGITAVIGFKDATTGTLYTSTFALPAGSWTRIYSNLQLPTGNQFLFTLTLSGTCLAFGAQVSPMKGEGAYQATPGQFGLHLNCRFDTDIFEVQAVQPGQNALRLPMIEFNS
jgi:hypothetical protein